MPEQLSKHPEVTLQVLQSAGAQCGSGAPQDILKACPAQSFCKLPGGEICVYGLPDAMQMTQVTQAEWRALLPAQAHPAPPSPAEAPLPLLPMGLALLAGLLIGFLVARLRRLG